MFGKPEWFRPKRIGWGLVPICWRGWLYTALWMLVMILPFLILLGRGQVPEAVLWLAGTMTVLVWDIRTVLRAMNPPAVLPTPAPPKPRPEIEFLDDDDASDGQLATRNFDMRLRD